LIAVMKKCDGCKYHWYSAPDGTGLKKFPHSRCLYFNDDIPMVVKVEIGCDGTKSKRWISNEIPKGCPTYLQGSLF